MMKDAVTTLTTARMVGLMVVQCIERWLHYNFSLQTNIYSFCIKIQVNASRCEVGGRIIYPANFTSTRFPRRMSRCRFGGKIILPPTSHLLVFQEEWVDVKLAETLFIPPNIHLPVLHHNLLRVSRCKFEGARYGNCFLPLTLVSMEE